MFKIFVPEQDASWELEGDQFDELEERYSTCDADTCVCPTGRETDEDYTYWEIVSTLKTLNDVLVIY